MYINFFFNFQEYVNFFQDHVMFVMTVFLKSTCCVNVFCQHVLSTIFLHLEQKFHKPGNQRQQQEQQRYV